MHLPSRCVAVRCRSPWRYSEPSVVSGHAGGRRLVRVFTIHGEVMMMHDAWPTSFSQLQQRMTSILFCSWCQVSKTEKSRLLQLTHVAARSFSACCVPTLPSYLVRASNLLHTHPPPRPSGGSHTHPHLPWPLPPSRPPPHQRSPRPWRTMQPHPLTVLVLTWPRSRHTCSLAACTLPLQLRLNDASCCGLLAADCIQGTATSTGPWPVWARMSARRKS